MAATAGIAGVISAIVAAILFFASSKCHKPAQGNGQQERPRKYEQQGGTPLVARYHDLEEGTPLASTPRPTTPDRSGASSTSSDNRPNTPDRGGSSSGRRREQMATTPPRGGGIDL